MDYKASLVEAVVTSVEGSGKKRYAVTKLSGDPPSSSTLPKSATVTFSLSEWKSEHEPKRGQLVSLGDIERFTKGWRARLAKPVRA